MFYIFVHFENIGRINFFPSTSRSGKSNEGLKIFELLHFSGNFFCMQFKIKDSAP